MGVGLISCTSRRVGTHGVGDCVGRWSVVESRGSEMDECHEPPFGTTREGWWGGEVRSSTTGEPNKSL
jgi:hypothetical protein